jgi:hypothetical protein
MHSYIMLPALLSTVISDMATLGIGVRPNRTAQGFAVALICGGEDT